MKVLVAIALAFFSLTFGFTVVHNVVHHEDEPRAVLPGAPSAPAAPVATTTTKVPVLHARLPLTLGATSSTNVADGRQAQGNLIQSNGTGTAAAVPGLRRVAVRALSNASDGHSIWFALVGSDITIDRGALDRGQAVIRIDGVTTGGHLRSDGGTASYELRLQVQDGTSAIVGETTIAQQTLSAAGEQSLDAAAKSATVSVTVDRAGGTSLLRAYLYAKVDAQGGSGATSVDLTAAYTGMAVAIGDAPPTTTEAPTPVAAPAPNATAGITAAQLAAHSTEQSCWLLIQGRVYDVSPFVRRHPGSPDALIKYCGKEATEAFLTQGGRGARHSYEAIDKLAKYFIGAYAG